MNFIFLSKNILYIKPRRAEWNKCNVNLIKFMSFNLKELYIYSLQEFQINKNLSTIIVFCMKTKLFSSYLYK